MVVLYTLHIVVVAQNASSVIIPDTGVLIIIVYIRVLHLAM